MTVRNRRDFLRHAGMSAAALTTLSGPLQAIFARGALAAGAAAENGGYGPLVPDVKDLRDRVTRLQLPEGFEYRSFALARTRTTDGIITPGRHDGMGVFPWKDGYRLVRNHEVNGPGPAFGDRRRAFDKMARGGTTTLEVSPHAEHVESWVSCNGTQMNCAGGVTPWGTWLTCEETINGPDVGPDFTGADNSLLQRRHGYVFEVPASWGPGEHRKPKAIRHAGRFAHEAVAVDPATGVLYLTEDNFNYPSGFYRYIAPRNPMEVRELRDGGRLEMLKVKGEPNKPLDKSYTRGDAFEVEWVRIDEPDTEFPEGTTNDEALNFVSGQGFAKGAAAFSRLEGIFEDRGRIYLVSTQGGHGREGDPGPSGGFGRGYGQVWMYDTREETLTLIFESPGKEVLELPDNLCISPKKSVLLCEDGPADNFLRGITPNGEIFDFARNVMERRRGDEFAGATFSPDGKVLFVNIQASEGLTFAIWGPWQNGAL